MDAHVHTMQCSYNLILYIEGLLLFMETVIKAKYKLKNIIWNVQNTVFPRILVYISRIMMIDKNKNINSYVLSPLKYVKIGTTSKILNNVYFRRNQHCLHIVPIHDAIANINCRCVIYFTKFPRIGNCYFWKPDDWRR